MYIDTSLKLLKMHVLSVFNLTIFQKIFIQLPNRWLTCIRDQWRIDYFFCNETDYIKTPNWNDDSGNKKDNSENSFAREKWNDSVKSIVVTINLFLLHAVENFFVI